MVKLRRQSPVLDALTAAELAEAASAFAMLEGGSTAWAKWVKRAVLARDQVIAAASEVPPNWERLDEIRKHLGPPPEVADDASAETDDRSRSAT